MAGYINVKEEIFVTFKFNEESILVRFDALAQKSDIFKEIARKTDGGILEHEGKVYNMLDLQEIELEIRFNY